MIFITYLGALGLVFLVFIPNSYCPLGINLKGLKNHYKQRTIKCPMYQICYKLKDGIIDIALIIPHFKPAFHLYTQISQT